MAQKLSNEGGLDILNIIYGSATRPTAFTLRLITDANALADSDTAASGHTAAAGGGYADKTLNLVGGSAPAATVSAVSSIPQVAWPTVTWTFTGALTSGATIKGYQILDATNSKLIVEELTTNFTPANNGDTYSVTPVIQAGNGTPVA
jgi:hypothetical protein